MIDGNVAVGPEYFKKALRDYADWRWAFVREFVQNGADCGSRNIKFWLDTVEHRQDGTELLRVSVQNDGRPMDRDELLVKLLSLGASSKDGVSTVGGHGKAKEILYFSQARYQIETGNLLLTGSGGSYRIGESEERLAGTRSTVWIECESQHQTRWMQEAVASYLPMVRSRAACWLNGRPVARLKVGKVVRQDDDFELRRCFGIGHQIVVAIRGLPMFCRDSKVRLYCNLKQASYTDLTANRDQLRGPLGDSFLHLISQIQTETLSFKKSIKTSVPDLVSYGRLFSPKIISKEQATSVEPDTDDYRTDISLDESVSCSLDRAAQDAFIESGHGSQFGQGIFRLDGRLGHKILLSSRNGRVPSPRYWHRDRVMPAIEKLVTRWANTLCLIHEIEQDSRPFGIGLVFCNDSQYRTAALCRTSDGCLTYLINPWGDGQTLRYRGSDYAGLVSIAAHEYVHGTGKDYHDEEFASDYTFLMSRLWLRHGEFQKLFRSSKSIRFNWPTGWGTMETRDAACT
jgi:hypothetical protein